MREANPPTPRATKPTKRQKLSLKRFSGLHKSPVRKGFTIVELLIVVVVIAILAAITIVAYNGITNNAKESALKSDLTTAVKKLNLEKVESGSFPGTYAATGLTYSGGGNAFCITGSANGKDFQIKETGNVEEGDCSLPVATTMQTFTPAHCSALEIFTGSNNSAVVNLTDARGGTIRTYEVAKLADGKCWMLTNLKLGSISSSITLTPNDSNVVDNFTLPQVISSGTSDLDNPLAYGPVPGDTGSGATNYGYLYNWPAATAGETRETKPMASPSADYSICPAGWRLPDLSSPALDSAWLNAKMNNLEASTYVSSSGASSYYKNWHFQGPFKGVFSGYWGYSSGYKFSGMGTYGKYWSSTPYSPNIAGSAFYIDTQPYVIYAKTNTGRSDGLAIRCLKS